MVYVGCFVWFLFSIWFGCKVGRFLAKHEPPQLG